MKGVLLALVIVLTIIGGLYLYSGVWPPLVVVESNSMQHSDTRSYIGVIDTGDLVILKKVTSFTQVRPYLDSVPDDYVTYSGYGDVVIYRPFGSYERTPIIHRALCKVEYNATGGGFDVPALAALPESMWEIKGGSQNWYNIKGTLVLSEIGFNGVQVRINFTTMLNNFANTHIPPHGGLITLGDNNRGIIDQSSLAGICWQPVMEEWLNGVARGEIPWFGLIKLYFSGQASQAPIPSNSQTNLLISLVLIIGVPIAIDVTALVLERRGVDVGARLRKALHLPPRKEKPKEEVEKSASKKEMQEKSASSSKKSGRPPSGAKKGGKGKK